MEPGVPPTKYLGSHSKEYNEEKEYRFLILLKGERDD